MVRAATFAGVAATLLMPGGAAAGVAEKGIIAAKGVVAAEEGIMLGRTVGLTGNGLASAKAYVAGYKNLPNGFTNVVMHGEQFEAMSFWQFNKFLDANGVTGNITLFICNAGKHVRSLELLAQRRGIEILASPYKIQVQRGFYEFMGSPAGTFFERFGSIPK